VVTNARCNHLPTIYTRHLLPHLPANTLPPVLEASPPQTRLEWALPPVWACDRASHSLWIGERPPARATAHGTARQAPAQPTAARQMAAPFAHVRDAYGFLLPLGADQRALKAVCTNVSGDRGPGGPAAAPPRCSRAFLPASGRRAAQPPGERMDLMRRQQRAALPSPPASGAGKENG
jgi:hypothetical protein